LLYSPLEKVRREHHVADSKVRRQLTVENQIMDLNVSDNAKALAAEKWFGYGRWDASYWLVGKEPGGEDEPTQYTSWLRLGGSKGAELIDCREHDLDCAEHPGQMLWHGPKGKLQATWRPLIALLLAYFGASEYDKNEVWKYQDLAWGTTRTHGKTAVIELSAVAAPDTTTDEQLRLTHLDKRIETIRSRIQEYRPTFVLFYGGGIDPIFRKPYIERWSKIAGTQLVQNEIVNRDGILYVATPHPTAPGLTNAFWTGLGRELAGTP
jgi:hypothetical protein